MEEYEGYCLKYFKKDEINEYIFLYLEGFSYNLCTI